MKAGPFPIPMAVVRLVRVLLHGTAPPRARQQGAPKAAWITVYSQDERSDRARRSA